MTKEAIIEEIKKHSKEEQREIIEAIREPGEEDYEITQEDVAVIVARRKYSEEHPETDMDEQQLWAKVNSLLSR